MRKIIYLTALLLFINSMQAQTLAWAKKWGGIYDDYAISADVDDSGNIYVLSNF